jgi:hypothetical protein
VSKRINVNPDHYKVAGRERPDTIAPVRLERARALETKSRDRWERRSKKSKKEKV